MRRLAPLAAGLLTTIALQVSTRSLRADDVADAAWADLAARAGSQDPATRAAALNEARTAADPRAVAAPIAAAAAAKKDRERVSASLRRTEQSLDAAWSDRDDEDHSFGQLKFADAGRVERHLRRDEDLRQKIRSLDAAADTASRAVADREAELEAARRAAASILARVARDDVGSVVSRLAAAWVRAPDAAVEDRIRFVEAVERSKSPLVDRTLREMALDPTGDPRVRAIALDASVERRAATALEDAVACLADPSWVVRAAAIDALRLLHEREAIEPLIAFLGRADLGRLREDACRALRSLTGESHGPYQEPWAAWWAEAKRDFEPPRRPLSLSAFSAPERGLTFYGITTFSDRVVFVLDVSGSMGESGRAAPNRDGARKVDIARRELFAAVDTLGDKARFGVVLFDRAVRRFGGGLSLADLPSRTRAKAWVSAREPRAETNLGDALREAFRLASGLDGPAPALGGADTLFLLTDGRPTAGALQSPERIVEAVRRWNRAARLTIHCVGLGDHDSGLLTELSAMTGGRYVKR